jgi:hypothetical protein
MVNTQLGSEGDMFLRISNFHARWNSLPEARNYCFIDSDRSGFGILNIQKSA